MSYPTRGQGLILASRKIGSKNLKSLYSLGIHSFESQKLITQPPPLPPCQSSKHQTRYHQTRSYQAIPTKRRIGAIAVESKCFYDISGMHK